MFNLENKKAKNKKIIYVFIDASNVEIKQNHLQLK